MYDNILPKELSNFIEDIVLNKPQIPLYYINNITASSSTTFSPGFHNTFYHPTEPYIKPFTPIFLEVIYRLSQFKSIILENIFLGRIFLHLPTPNPGPDIKHVDLKFPHWVCLYYINDSEGDTILFYEKDEEIKRVTPKKGRIVFFDGSIKHCSSRPHSKTRAILNFDFLGRKF